LVHSCSTWTVCRVVQERNGRMWCRFSKWNCLSVIHDKVSKSWECTASCCVLYSLRKSTSHPAISFLYNSTNCSCWATVNQFSQYTNIVRNPQRLGYIVVLPLNKSCLCKPRAMSDWSTLLIHYSETLPVILWPSS
jgi:hypothetical protein